MPPDDLFASDLYFDLTAADLFVMMGSGSTIDCECQYRKRTNRLAFGDATCKSFRS